MQIYNAFLIYPNFFNTFFYFSFSEIFENSIFLCSIVFVSQLCTYDLLKVALIATEKELGVNPATDCNTKEAAEARYHFVFFAFNRLNARPKLIQSFLPNYKYGKTVYQVIRRAYLRRKNPDNRLINAAIERHFEKLKDKYKPVMSPVKYTTIKQLKLYE